MWVAVPVLMVTTCLAAAPGAEHPALRRAQQLLENGDYSKVDLILHETETATLTDSARRTRFDVQGQMEVMQGHPLQALHYFVRSLTYTGATSDHSNMPPKVTTVYQCAESFAGWSHDQIEEAYQHALQVAPQALDGALSERLNAGRWLCPSGPPPPPVAKLPSNGTTSLPPDDQAPNVPTGPLSDPGRYRVPAVATTVAAGVVGGLGGVLGFLAKSKTEGLTADNFDAGISTAQSYALGANVSYGVAGGVALAAAVLWWLDHGARNESSPPMGSGSAVVRF
jgi:hypothetical protein